MCLLFPITLGLFFLWTCTPFEYLVILTIILNCVVLGSETKLPAGDSVWLNQKLVRSILAHVD